MADPPNKRPYDQSKPDPQYQQPSGQPGQYQQPSGQYPQQPSGQYQQPYQNPQYQKPDPPPPDRKCAEPQPPKDPCTDPTAPTPPEPCLVQPFSKKIQELEQQSNEEDKETSKGELAAFKKLSDEVWQAEKDYARDFESLLLQEANSEVFYEKMKTDLDPRLSDTEKRRIAEIVYCRPHLEDLRWAWIAARNEIPDLQRIFAIAQLEFSDQEEIYKAALRKFQNAQKSLDAVQALVGKEFNARNYRNAWYLNEFEMCPALDPPPLPCEFNPWLEAIARDHVWKGEALRKAKVALDQKTAEAQRKKKEYEDAKAKRRDDILKAIASDPFPVDPKPPQPTSQNKPGNYQSNAA